MQSELSLLEQIKLQKIWTFPGGIHPPEQKELSNQTPIINLPLSKKYYVPVKQHIGSVDDVIVTVGEQVLANQPLTAANLTMTVPVHAPVAGRVIAIAPHVSAHPSAKPELSVIIEADELQQSVEPQKIDNWQTVEKFELVEQIKRMGISGMGGAGFPTHIKMHPTQDIDVLILNGVECEPYITADDTLMKQYSAEIIEGALILQHVLQSKVCIVAIEDNKPDAVDAMKKAAKEFENIEIRVVPTKYPSGGEKQLIQLLTGMQVPSGKIPADLGIVMQNVGTAFAVKEAIIDGLPLTQRVVTITGETLNKPQNVWAKLGTPVQDLLTFADFKAEKQQRIIMGGPMMGFAILDTSMPVVKTTNCILAPSAKKLPPQGDEQACIRCGLCADACPAELLPQQLQWFAKAKDHDKLSEYNLFDCIECGACAYVCPSQIPLVQYYRTSKAEIREAEQEKIKSEKARIRFEQRQERLEREKQERLEKHKASAEKRAKALEKDTSAKDKIAAALARAKAKKQSQNDSTANVSDSEAKVVPNANKDKVAEAIARAKAKKAAKQIAEKQDDEDSALVETPEATQTAKQEKANHRDNEQLTEEQKRKAKVAAAIARAKQKKQESVASDPKTVAATDTVSSEAESSETKTKATESSDILQEAQPEALTPEQIRKQKVAAAIAKAKAKKSKSDT
ncbi:electron transport complex subunit RsxC [Psychrosphaera aestuarii]|uniref:electron transport complex subunit RsxC n=1 Tax=Psychrosphaera aestuarii TaxID=1266052 RepID=UPI001FD47161|nr:electron transport complex subunit RsxC [Psychrosphaera aestuarii]